MTDLPLPPIPETKYELCLESADSKRWALDRVYNQEVPGYSEQDMINYVLADRKLHFAKMQEAIQLVDSGESVLNEHDVLDLIRSNTRLDVNEDLVNLCDSVARLVIKRIANQEK